MKQSRWLILAASASIAVLVTGCTTATGSSGKTDLVVWDYYGQSSPVTAAIQGFEKDNPDIHVDLQEFDYNTIYDKFSVAVSSGSGPDLATVDMTWLPTYASQGLLSDLNPVSNGKVDGTAFADVWSSGALDAMTYDKKYVAALYDFDAYALYYRADIFKAKGLTVPTTWDELLTTSAAMVEDQDGDGKPDHFGFQVQPDPFHYAQLLYQNGGSILTKDGTASALDSPAAVDALDYMHKLLAAGGIYWGAAQGDMLQGIKDDQIGMFVNGPYMMGVLKSGAPEMAGKWAVAPMPYSKQPGSYLGGTGLVIPTGAKNGSAAWKFSEYLLQQAQQEKVFTVAGAAPATLAGLSSPAVTQGVDYLGGQAPFSTFADAMSTATPFPYVAQWGDISKAMTDAVDSVLLDTASSKDALKAASDTIDAALKK